jgi:hypothetical protein
VYVKHRGTDIICAQPVVLWRLRKAAEMSAGNNNNGKKVFEIKPNVKALCIQGPGAN